MILWKRKKPIARLNKESGDVVNNNKPNSGLASFAIQKNAANSKIQQW
jgi:hypothetical protein